jgi:putative NIF3 family GTP cyclohydrolase 1 type 2
MMKLREMYETAVQIGMRADPRGEAGLARVLELARQEYEDLKESDRWEFDQERLVNPFADTRILYGDPETEVGSMLVGIDIDPGEVLLVDALRARGRSVDMVLAHHPEGRALNRLEEVMMIQPEVWRTYGVPINFGEAVMAERMSEITRGLHPHNCYRAVNACTLLDIPFMCAHTAADNCVNGFVQKQMDELGEDATVGEVVKVLKAIPEYHSAVLLGSGPSIFVGDPKRRTGKIMVDMTGGTEGPLESLGRLSVAGVGTIVGMHMREEHRKRAESEHLNVVIAGHLSSDSLGMNLILDEYEKRGMSMIPCSAFTRVSRV